MDKNSHGSVQEGFYCFNNGVRTLPNAPVGFEAQAALVKLVKDKGYDGKFGLQCYNIRQDCEVALTKSIQTWQAYQKRYREK